MDTHCSQEAQEQAGLPSLLKSLSLGTDPPHSLPSTPSCAGFLEPRDPGGFWAISSCLGGCFLFFFKATQGGGAGREAYDWAGASLGWRPTRARASQGWAVAPNPYLGETRSPASPPSWDQPCLAFPASLPFILHQAPQGHPGGRAVGSTLTVLPGDRGLT